MATLFLPFDDPDFPKALESAISQLDDIQGLMNEAVSSETMIRLLFAMDSQRDLLTPVFGQDISHQMVLLYAFIAGYRTAAFMPRSDT